MSAPTRAPAPSGVTLARMRARRRVSANQEPTESEDEPYAKQSEQQRHRERFNRPLGIGWKGRIRNEEDIGNG